MRSNTNYNIYQVTENTLVIGIDIAKKKQYACAIDEQDACSKNHFLFSQSIEGFDVFYEKVLALRAIHEKRKIVGFEPTDHYWMNLIAYFSVHGILFVMLNPHHVNRSKELGDNLQTKNDQKDALVIARYCVMDVSVIRVF
ncbi:IS110 family transposase [Lysinibacillus xylanilyticus]|uniref:IS110 family transposase n=1 Tax=Lysinibacillus xylanilyticus TaxID=582475 RepID=UPI003D05B4D8